MSFRAIATCCTVAIISGLFTQVPVAFSADGESDSAEAPLVTKALLSRHIEELKSDAKLDAETKKDAIDLLTTAIDDCEAGLAAEQRKLRLLRQLETADRELETLRRQLAEPSPKTTVNFSPDTNVEELERRRDKLEQTLEQPETGLRDRVGRLERELAERATRLESLGEEVLTAEQRLTDVQAELKDLPDDDDDATPLTVANRLGLQAAMYRAHQEVAALDAEQQWLESADADRWIRTLRQIAERDVEQVESDIKLVEDQLQIRRRGEAAERVELARQDALSVLPAWKTWANENQQLAERSRLLTERIDQIEREQKDSGERLESLDQELSEMQTMVQAVGRNDAMGLMLRQQLSRLPDASRLRSTIAAHEDELREIKLKLFETERQRRQSPEVETLIQAAGTSAGDAASLAKPAETIVTHRHELLDQLREDYQSLFSTLVELVQTDRKLLARARSTTEFYEDQMLWMRSGNLFGFRDIQQFRAGLNWLGDRQAWREIPATLLVDLERRPVLYLLAALATWAFLLIGERRGGRPAAEHAAAQEFSLAVTLRAIGLTALGAGLVPAMLAFAAWRIDHNLDRSIWLHSLANGLWRCAAWSWPLLILRNASRIPGLFATDSLLESARRLSRRSTWFLLPSICLMLIVGMTEGSGNEVISDSLGRGAFLVLMVLTGLFCRGLLKTAAKTGESATFGQARWLPFLTLAIPLAPWGLAAFAFAGYYDTALRLAWRLEATAWLWLVLAGANALGSRWIAGEKQRLELLPESTDPKTLPTGPLAESRKSLFARLRDRQSARGLAPQQISRQIAVLLQTLVMVAALGGVAALWHDVIPTGSGNHWTLWQTTITSQIADTADNGNSSVRTVTRLAPVTVFNVALAMLICGVTFVAARNIPGLMEVLFLERLPLDVGARFAVTILVRYALVVVGTIFACGQIYVGWANVQWLVAAASVGLGFGLQEIFANFVSGIILLFERPIRVGDVITIGDTTGTVSQIRFRSTTILDADRRELVVPNKDLITGKLLNWTLSDQTNRIKIRVAVSFDSDPDRVRTLLQEIALVHPAILKDPAPVATFEEFGPSTLIFNLCAFLPSLDDRAKVLHELHSSIHARLQQEGIAFPKPAPPAIAAPPTKGVAA